MLRFRAVLVLLLVSVSGFANIPHFNTDSLKSVLQNDLNAKKGTADTTTVDRMNKLAGAYIDLYPDSTLHYGQIAVNMARNLHYERGIAEGLIKTGKVNYFKGNYTKAENELEEARLLFSHLNDKHGLARCYNEIGHMYNRIGNYVLAMKNLKTALGLAQEENDLQCIGDIYVNMGTVSDNMGRSSVALDYYFKSLDIDIKTNNQLEAARNYNDIGVVLQNMEIYPKALDYFHKCLRIWLDHNDALGICTAYENIGEVMLALKRYDEAIGYLNKSLKITLRQDDKDGISSLYNDLGLCYAHKRDFKQAIHFLTLGQKIATDFKIDYNRAANYVAFATAYNLKGDYQQAFEYASQGRTLANKLGSLSVRSNAALQLSKALGGLKIYDEAYETQKEYDELKDSLKSDENVQKLTSYNLETNFSERQHQQQVRQQERELHFQENLRQQRLLLAIFLIIIFGMIGMVIIYYRSKKKQQMINVQLEQKNTQVVKQKSDLDEQAHKLNDLNTLKDRLISILAHDLRAPLSTLRGLFNLLQDDTLTHQELLEMIPQVLKRLEYTSDFLDTLLFWINSQMENFDSSAKIFDIAALAGTEVVNNRDQAASKGIALISEVPESTVVTADPNSIRIVLRNLIANAIKFSRHDDQITISAHEAEGMTLISVKDTGVGMKPEQMNKLFKGKVNSGTGTDNESGTGMGLLFCKDLVERSNGKIWVNSVLGVGTEFIFSLPTAGLNAPTAQSAGKQISMQL